MDKEKELSPIALDSVAYFSIDDTFDSDKFIKMKLMVMHDGLNLNNTIFHEEGMIEAKESVFNIPILGNVVVDKDGKYDFNGHDKHIEVQEDKTQKIIYDELPIGVVPESAIYEVIKKDGKKWAAVDAYIWRGYSNYAEDIINEKETIPLSMEIFADKFTFDKKEKTFDISKFRYKAITFLGNEKEPAMKKAGASLNFSKEANELLTSIKEMLNDELKSYEKGGNEEMNKEVALENEVVEGSVALENPTGEEKANDVEEHSVNEKETTEEKVVDEFVTYNQLRSILKEALKTLNIDSKRLQVYHYLVDFDENHVIYQKCVCGYDENDKWFDRSEYFRKKYSVDEDNVVSLDEEEVKMVVKFLTVEEDKEIEKQRKELQEEFALLKEYKDKAEKEIREKEEKELFSKFDSVLNVEEKYNTLKDNAENYSIEELEEKCYSLAGRMSFANNKPEKKEKGIVVNYEIEDEQVKRSPYGSIVDKYY